MCIGNNFALMEATLVLAMATRRNRLDLVPGRTVEPSPRGRYGPARACG
jgi:cytochrome P450